MELISEEKVNSSTLPRLLIPRAVYSAILAQAEAERPLECCGLLAGPPAAGGTELHVVRHFPLVNAAASPVEYESEPRSMFAAVKDMRHHGWDVLAVYHSHPTSPPIPSRKDLARNYSEGVVNLIISLQSAQPEARGWWLTASDYREAEWDCTEM
jgi:proteasome lid subunit RPN8/RPN11